MRVLIKKHVVRDLFITKDIRCDCCNKYVIKDDKCVSSYWRHLYSTGTSADEESSPEEFDLCAKCFDKTFKKKRANVVIRPNGKEIK